jgi:hypothetical protein
MLLAGVGCVHDAYLAHSGNAVRYTRVVDNTPNCVAAVLEAGFGSIDVVVVVKRTKGEIRLVGTTKSGRVFGVFVRRGQSAETSVVTVHWDGEPDERLWESLVEWLAICKRHGDSPPKGT